MEKQMRILMTGGGTAGHVNPALAIADTLRKKHPEAVIEFVASTQKSDKAQDLVERAGYKLHRLDICGRYKLWDPRNLKTLYLMIKSERQARALIAAFRPDVIIGTGGYACYPVLNAGADMGIPTLVHESNAIAGKAVKKLALKVDCVMTNFQSTTEAIKGAKRTVRVGNPSLFDEDGARKAAAELGEDKYTRRVVSFGGSGGSESFNDEIYKLLSVLAKKYPDTEFRHATGKRDHARSMEECAKYGLDKLENVVISEYIFDMGARMSRADLIICRAGAMTISELALLGKAAIFVPSPYVAENHQYKNAKAIYDKGACELVEEKDFASGALSAAVEKLLNDEKLREQYSERIKEFADPDANEKIYLEIKNLAWFDKEEQ
jgi:UDP-N-acetylglucosamine--N-acetylmuramyl-(pentapeptide) pyrophosphoryl-undecaprenol N-acetylglucosamine transferase